MDKQSPLKTTKDPKQLGGGELRISLVSHIVAPSIRIEAVAPVDIRIRQDRTAAEAGNQLAVAGPERETTVGTASARNRTGSACATSADPQRSFRKYRPVAVARQYVAARASAPASTQTTSVTARRNRRGRVR